MVKPGRHAHWPFSQASLCLQGLSQPPQNEGSLWVSTQAPRHCWRPQGQLGSTQPEPPVPLEPLGGAPPPAELELAPPAPVEALVVGAPLLAVAPPAPPAPPAP